MGYPSLDALMAAAIESREQNGPDHNWAPIVVYYSRDNKEALAMLGASDPVPQQLVSALVEMHKVMGPAEWIAFTGDTYASYIPTDDPSDENIREILKKDNRNLAKEFKDGSSNVIEMMVVMLATKDLDIDGAYMAYRYIPTEGWEWDEPEIYHGKEHGGGVYVVLEAFFQAQQIANKMFEGDK